MIEAGQMTLDTFIAKQSAWVAQLVQQYRGATLPSAARAELPAVRRPDAPAHWQERRVLSCSRYPDCKGTQPVETATGKPAAPRPRRRSPKAS